MLSHPALSDARLDSYAERDDDEDERNASPRDLARLSNALSIPSSSAPNSGSHGLPRFSHSSDRCRVAREQPQVDGAHFHLGRRALSLGTARTFTWDAGTFTWDGAHFRVGRRALCLLTARARVR